MQQQALWPMISSPSWNNGSWNDFIDGVLRKLLTVNRGRREGRGEEYHAKHHLTWLKCLRHFHNRILLKTFSFFPFIYLLFLGGGGGGGGGFEIFWYESLFLAWTYISIHVLWHRLLSTEELTERERFGREVFMVEIVKLIRPKVV